MKTSTFQPLIKRHAYALLVTLLCLASKEQSSAQSTTYSTPGTYTFTVPAGVTSVTVSTWGGGGAGGGFTGGNPRAGGGGKGGSFVRGTIAVVPATNYTVIVGSGGTGGTGNGGSGGASSFGGSGLFYAIGGVGGNGATSTSNFGSGGTATNTGNVVSGSFTSNFYGGNGGTGTSANTASSGGGGGSAGAGSNGGDGGSPLTAGSAGTGSGVPADAGAAGAAGRGSMSDGNGNTGGSPGAGGSGGRNANNSTSYTGGNGAAGQVIIVYNTYKVSFPNLNYGASTWCAGETRSVTLTITNTGTASWTSAASAGGVNLSYWWSSQSGRDANPRIYPFANLLPGASQTVTISITAPAGASPLTLRFDLVKEGYCWFGDNTANCTGPGNPSPYFSSSSITINAQPSITSQSTPAQTRCQGVAANSMSITATGAGLTYQWYSNTVASNSGGTLISGATSSSFTPPTTSPGTLYYYCIVSGTCSPSVTSAVSGAIIVNPLPGAAGTITGTTPVCQGQNAVAYSIPAIANATGYVWTLPTGATIASGANTNNITVNYSTTATSGNITVYGTNTCGNGTVSTSYAVTVNPLPAPAGTITGTTPVCQGQNGVVYSVPAITNATGYVWTLPTGATIATGANTNSITVNYSATATSGNITVYGTNTCGNGTVSASYAVTVNPLPVAAGAITGTATVCQGQNGVAYSIPAITNATGYVWTLPTGATIATGANTNNITVNYSTTASSGNITVYGTNTCGNGTVSASYAVTVNPLPAAAGTITGTATVCQGQGTVAYSVPVIANATSYLWAYSGTGATITGTGNSITIDFSATATSGNLTVSGTNNCGNGTISPNYAVTVYQPPVITTNPGPAAQTVCASTNVTYTVSATGSGLTYQWFKNGNPISGATTSTLLLTNVTVGDNGSYTVTVSGLSPCASATSTPVSLIVDQRIVYTVQPVTPQTICQGQPYTISATATGTVAIYKWYKGGIYYADATVSGNTYSLTIPAVVPGDAGSYVLTLDDGTGIGCTSANSNAAILNVNIPSVGGSVSADATVCSGVNSGTLTLSGYTGTIVRWESSTDNFATVISIANTTTSQAYSNLTQTTQYRAVVQSGVCPSDNSAAANITVNPIPNAIATPSSQPVCSGTAITTIELTGGVTGTTFAWTRDNTTSVTGIAASGSGDISGTLTNSTNAPVTVTFTITPTANTCVGSAITATVTVNPIPALSSSLTPPARCSNTSGTYTATSAVTGTTFTWARAAVTGISNAAASGSGATITETLINTTANPVNVIYAITLTANGCSNTQNVTVTVNPSPTLSSSLTPPARCSNTSGTYTATSATSGTTYTWTRVVVTGISNAAASGSGATITETLINTTANPVNVVYAITLTANGCSNTQNVTVTVNPSPTLSSTLTPAAICSNTTFSYTPTSTTTGSTFAWSRAAVAGISNAAATGTNNPNETLINTTATTINVTYVYTLTANGCTNTQNVVVAVNPTPTLSSSLTPPARCSNVSTTYTATSATSGTTYTWTRAAVTGITPATGSGGSANITETLVNSTANPIAVTYVITLLANGCSNTQNVSVTINPSPTLSSSLTPPAICSNTAFSYTPTSTTTGVTFSWSRAVVTGISNAAATGTNNPNETLINTTASPVNVTYVYTLSANGCSNTQNVVVTVNPTPTLSSSLTPAAICSNTVFSYTPTSATTGTTFDWSRAAVTGISNAAATGTNNPNETLINTTANPVNVVYVYTLTANGCTNTQNVTVSVKPTPVLSSSLTPPARCSNVSTTYTATSATSGTTYTWTRAAVTGIAPNTGSGGSANITETLVNSTANPITVTYVIILTANSCSNTQSVNVTVNPSPTLSSSLTPPAICSNTAFSYTPTSNTTGVTFNWSRAAVTGISNAAATGTNNPNETLINTTANPVNVTYAYTLSANGCSNTQNVVVTVNPTPTLSSSLTQNRCDNVSATYTATSATSNTTFTWTRAAVTGISNAAGSGSGAAITETLDNTTTDPVSVIYVITLTANGCSNTQNVTVTVYPLPVLTSSLTPPARCSNVSTTYTATSATSGVTYTWTRAAVTGITPNTGSGGSANIVETLVNSTPNPINVTYAITLTANGCSNTQNVVVTVNPSPALSSSPTQNRCDNVSGTYTATSATTGTTFTWSRAAVAGISNAAASGSGNTITETLDNTTANPINITYVITLSANGCSNTQNVTVTVNPTPVLSSTLTPPARCSNTSGTYTATSATTAATYTWSRAAVTGISNAAASGSGATITETLVNTTTSPINVIYAITLTINGCTNTQNVTLTINPLPSITPAATAAPKCFSSSAQTTTLAYSNATASPTTYSINYNTAANAAGFVDITDAPLSATPITINIAANTAPGTYTGSITVKNANGCTSGSATNFTVTINALPTPTLGNSPDDPICANTNETYTTESGQSNYVWTFSGVAGTDYVIVSGGNSTSNTAVITWKTAGTKTATVNYTNSNGCTAVTPASNAITVLAVPTGTFAATETSGTTPNDNIICVGDNVKFTAPAGYGAYNFKVNNVSVQNGTSNIYNTTSLTIGTSSVTVDIANSANCGKTFGPIVITVNALPTPGLTVTELSGTPNDNVICANASVTLTGSGGNNYSFLINGSTVASGASNTFTTTSLTATSTVAVIVTNSNSCQATSATQTITVNPVPTGSLSVSPSSTFCAGTNVTFTATAGTGNTYNFKVDGTSVQNTAANTYSTNTLTNGQIVTVTVTNSSGCTAQPYNTILVNVKALPSGTLTASENSGTPNDNSICPGTPVTFIATAGYASYDFQVNGISKQNTASNTYTTSILGDNDKVKVIVKNSSNCTAQFNEITISVIPAPVGTLSVSPSSTICAGDNVTFTATTGFDNYAFRVNGNLVQNGNSNIYSSNTLNDNDKVTVDVTNSNVCTASFNAIIMTVNPLPTGTMTISENSGTTPNDAVICTGASVTFTAPNGFTNYNFIVNGVSVQSSAVKTYTTTTLQDDDKVTVAVTNSGSCIGLLNEIKVKVNPLPTVAIITGPGEVCVGNNITLADATTPGIWSSQNTAVATVNATTGVVTGVAGGTVTVVYTYTSSATGCSNTATTSITVNALPVVASITGNQNVCTGFTSQLNDATPGGVWSSSDNTIATVDNTGLVTGNNAGNATISYTVTDAKNCSTTVTLDIVVSTTPTVAPITTTAPSGFNVCVGSVITLNDATPGGVWSSSAPLTASVSTSGVVSGVAAGTANISYSITTSCGQTVSAVQTVTVNAPPSAAISYTGGSFCTTSSPVTVTQTGTTGGNYTAGSGLSINASSGTITPSASTPGNYTVTYTIAASGGCTAYTTTTPVTITAAPTAAISYSGSPFCTTSATINVSRTGTSGGIYSALPAGLTIDGTTGTITPATSTAGSYTITYSISASGGCAAFSTTTSVAITQAPSATISYTGNPFCTTSGTVIVGRTGTAGGTYSVLPAGLTINTANGTITPATSTAGSYTVTYTIAASGGCAAFSTTTSVTITAAATASAGTAVQTCSNTGAVNITAGASASNYSSVQWLSSGTGTFANGNSLTAATYTPSAADISAGSVSLTLRANGNGNCGAVNSTPKTLTISPATAITAVSAAPSPLCLGNSSNLTIAPATSANLISENFDGATSSFSVVNGAGNVAGSEWTKRTSSYSYPGSVTFNDGSKFMLANSDITHDVANTSLVSSSVNTTGYSALTLSYKTYFRKAAFSNTDAGRVEISTNGGSTWTTVQTLNSTTGASNNGFATQTIALNSYIGNTSVIIRFRYTGDDDWYWAVDDVVLTASGSSYTYAWSATPATGGLPAGAGTFSSSNANIVVTPTAVNSYTYTATLKNGAGCTSTSSVNLNVQALPTVNIIADYCTVPGKVHLTANASTGVTYLWSTGETTQSIDVDIAGNYDVTVKFSASGCQTTASIQVANELVKNGNFELGDNGDFTTLYTSHTGSFYNGSNASGLYPEGDYAIDVSAYSPSNGVGYHPQFHGRDHTTGSGKFMMVNGAQSIRTIWTQTVSVLPNTTYYFSAWGMNLNPASPAQLQFSVNGVQTGSVGDLNTAAKPTSESQVNTSNWIRFYGTLLTDNTTTTAVISIVNLNTTAGGNDFGLDDISFGTLSTFISLDPDYGSDAQVLCANTPLNTIIYNVGNGNSSGPSVTGLPPGITSSFQGDRLIISGTPTTVNNYTYTITTAGCNPQSVTGTITVQGQKIALTSGTASPSVCINNAVTNIVYTVSGTATDAAATGLPAGVNGVYNNGTFTISGTPTVAGSYPYTITTKPATGACTPVTATGTITVQSQTVTLNTGDDDNQTVCINSPVSIIRYNTGGTVTGASATGLPAGVTGVYNSGIFTISGTPTAAGTYTYQVTTSGSSCTAATITGKITVTPSGSLALTSGSNPQPVCRNAAITNIVYTVNNATGASVTGLPAGLTGAYSGGTFTISGTVTAAAGTYNYVVTTSGGCGPGSVNGSIVVQAQTIALASGSSSPTVCANVALPTNIVYIIGGTATGAGVTGLPAGLTGALSGSSFTISGTPTASPGAYTYIITTTGTCSGATATGTITIQAPPVGGTLTSVSICSGASGTLTLSGQSGTITRWEVSTDFGSTWSPITNTTISQNFSNVTTTTMYRVVIGGCGTTYSTVATVGVHNLWTGRTSRDWNVVSNWSDNLLPSATCTAVIVPVTSNPPQLTADANVPGISIASGANVDLNGYTLTVNGAFSGTGTVTGGVTSGLAVTGNTDHGTVYFTRNLPYNQLKTLTVNSGTLSLGGTSTNGDTLNIVGGNSSTGYGTVTADGILNTNGIMTLRSNQDGTARIGQSSGSITGNVLVERYIGGHRAWRYLTAPVSGTQTINSAWQEGVNNPDLTTNINPKPGYGTQISGGSPANGFDVNTTGNPSILTWDEPSQDWMYVAPPTKTTRLDANKGYYAFVRGSRAVNLAQGQYAAADSTKLRAKGTLQLGAVSKSLSGSGGPGGHLVVGGNPYASSINILNVLSSSTNITNGKFYVYDPLLAGSYGVGAVVTYSGGTFVPRVPGGGTGTASYPDDNSVTTTQSGQAFLVELQNTSGSLNFKESDKITTEYNVFGLRAAQPRKPLKPDPKVYINLNLPEAGDSLLLLDGVAAVFDNRYSDSVDYNDAIKNTNVYEDMSLMRYGKALAIETRPIPNKADTLYLNIGNVLSQPYVLQVLPEFVPAAVTQAWLIDKYLNSQTALSTTQETRYTFSTTGDAASYSNRFMIVFTVEPKKKADSTAPIAKSVNMQKLEGTVSVSPNPVTGRQNAQLKFSSMPKGDYEVEMYNSAGRKMMTRTISHPGGEGSYPLTISTAWAADKYNIAVVNKQTQLARMVSLIISR